MLVVLFLAYAAGECIEANYYESYAAFEHNGSCYVTYQNYPALTWYAVAANCVERGSSLASFDTSGTDQINFVISRQYQHIPGCTKIGLVKTYFRWNSASSGKHLFLVYKKYNE